MRKRLGAEEERGKPRKSEENRGKARKTEEKLGKLRKTEEKRGKLRKSEEILGFFKLALVRLGVKIFFLTKGFKNQRRF